MKNIKNTEAFEDAQILARMAVYSDGLVAPEAFWFAAMMALKAAYTEKNND